MTRPAVAYEPDPESPEPSSNRLLAVTPWIALLALAAAVATLTFVFVTRSSNTNDCRSAAWHSIPNPDDLPGGWSLGTTDMNANGMTISILGPVSSDGTSNQPAVYASVTCYGDVAATAMSQNKAAAKAAGSKVTNRSDGGDAYDVADDSTGSTTTLFRVGSLIGQIADAGTATPDDLATITAAVAAAMGDETAAGNPGPASSADANASEEPGSSDLGGVDQSAEPSPSAAAPELEADMPTSIQGTPLTVDSATGDTALTSDPASRALAARLQSLGVKLTDIQVARAYDDSGTVDMTAVGFRLPGLAPDKLKAAVLEAWLGANQAGVKQTSVKLGDKTVIKVDYGADAPADYVYATPDHVIVLDTSDPSAATEAAGQIK